MTPHRHDDDEVPIYDRGLQFDIATLMDRRKALKMLGVAGLFGIAACGTAGVTTTLAGASPTTTSGSAPGTTGGSAGTTTLGGSCEIVPEETAGPFPGDGSNGPNVLDDTGIVRTDITASFGESTGVADGVPLTIALTVLDSANGCAPLAGGAVYVWHCDRAGNYSMYSDAAANQNYLRGVQETDANGTVTFQSIFPACYSGRWPHIHFEVYPDVASATSSENKIATSQIALPEDSCNLVYATSGYEQSITNLSRVSLQSDNVFSDGWDEELGTVTGDVDNGMKVALTVAV